MQWDRTGLLHEGYFFESDDALAERCVPFVEDALALGDPLVVVAAAETLAMLRRHVGDRIVRTATLFVDAATWWRGEALRTLAAYREAMGPLMGSGRPWRLIGQPVWLDAARGAHWSRVEAACNVTFAALPYHSLCLHDLRRLSATSVSAARQTHPWTVCDGALVPSGSYVEPARFLEQQEPPWTEPAGAVRSHRVTSCRQARRIVGDFLADGADTPDGADRADTADTADTAGGTAADASTVRADVMHGAQLTASELVANALEHGQDAVHLRLWRDVNGAVIEVGDRGSGFDARFAGYTPPDPNTVGGRGLWLARCLADDLVVRSGPHGTVARIHVAATPVSGLHAGSAS